MKKETVREIKRIGVLTGGGDCPGLNAAIRAIVKRGHEYGYEILGIRDGWKGLLKLIQPSHTNGEVVDLLVKILRDEDVRGILSKGGTILGSSRTNPMKSERGIETVINNFKNLGLHALIVIGGEDTLSVAVKLKENKINVIGIPKTIDNDVGGTDSCIGFDTAVSKAVAALDDIHSTAESHHRVIILEVMGRDYGWVATMAGYAGGADYILIPEKPVDVDEVVKSVLHRYEQGKNFSLIAISEGAKIEGREVAEEIYDSFGHKKLGGVGEVLAGIIKDKTGLEVRAINLGHLLRGGSPVPSDRILASRFGIKAVELLKKEKFGRMVALKGKRISSVPLEEALKQRKVDPALYKEASIFFG